MIVLNKEQIIMMHSMLIKQTGGLDGIRDEGLLDSAINTPFQSFAGEELYPTVQKKAASLCYGLIKNHAFNDANKRIGILTTMTFMELNNLFVNCSNEEIINLGLNVASGVAGQEEILSWIIAHT